MSGTYRRNFGSGDQGSCGVGVSLRMSNLGMVVGVSGGKTPLTSSVGSSLILRCKCSARLGRGNRTRVNNNRVTRVVQGCGNYIEIVSGPRSTFPMACRLALPFKDACWGVRVE